MALKLLVYDGTSQRGETALRTSWSAGARLYRGLRRVDAFLGASSWAEALAWCVDRPGADPIGEIQFWGHGKWGEARIAGDCLSTESFHPDHPHAPLLRALRDRLLPDGRSLVWFRTCETFGAVPGHRFAQTLTTSLGARGAGHTFVIGALQSGLHGLAPGQTPGWPPDEGLARGAPEFPVSAHDSSARAPNTVHFMTGAVPPSFFQSD